eukprot:TRINITY_DN3436_c0_g1_i1.p1 TRINITY_DN3436_c0_g1~~TRINITY_DN3436_c0_g1_i1.p1  ORF type:complete len:319 (+),score=47.54 TRINITY_DN3436_c0_g1_i1:143-1099(+)
MKRKRSSGSTSTHTQRKKRKTIKEALSSTSEESMSSDSSFTTHRRKRGREGKRRRKSDKSGKKKTKKRKKIIVDVSNPFLFCMSITDGLIRHNKSWPFLEPVDHEGLGLIDYPDIIVEPMDFGTIKQKLEDKRYQIIYEWARDIRLVFENTFTYNTEDAEVSINARTLSKIFEKHYSRHIEIQNPYFDTDIERKLVRKYILLKRADIEWDRDLCPLLKPKERFSTEPLTENLLHKIATKIPQLKPQYYRGVIEAIEKSSVILFRDKHNFGEQLEIPSNEIAPQTIRRISQYLEDCEVLDRIFLGKKQETLTPIAGKSK